MSIKLQIRRGTAANWAGANPTLLAGEIGFETDTGNLKVGDGTNVWSDLAYQFPYLTGARNHAPEDVTTLVIDQTNDRVGIGTNTPQAKVHITDDNPIIRMTDTSAPTVYATIDASGGTSGSITIGADVGNTAASSTLNLAVDGSTKVTVDAIGEVGIGTTNPQRLLHIEGTEPIIRLRDTTGGNTAHSEINANTDAAGGIVIGADANNASGANASYVRLAVDGTTRVEATTTGAAVTGTLDVSGTLTPTGGVAANTVSPTAITNQTGPVMLGRLTATSGAVSALTQSQARQTLNNYAPVIGGTDRAPGDTAAVAGDYMIHTSAGNVTYTLPGTSSTRWFVINLVRETGGGLFAAQTLNNSGIYAGGTVFPALGTGYQYKSFAWCIGTV